MWLEREKNVGAQLPIVLTIGIQDLLALLLDEQDARLLQAALLCHFKIILIFLHNAQPLYQQQLDQHKQHSDADSQAFFQIPMTAIGEYGISLLILFQSLIYSNFLQLLLLSH